MSSGHMEIAKYFRDVLTEEPLHMVFSTATGDPWLGGDGASLFVGSVMGAEEKFIRMHNISTVISVMGLKSHRHGVFDWLKEQEKPPFVNSDGHETSSATGFGGKLNAVKESMEEEEDGDDGKDENQDSEEDDDDMGFEGNSESKYGKNDDDDNNDDDDDDDDDDKLRYSGYVEHIRFTMMDDDLNDAESWKTFLMVAPQVAAAINDAMKRGKRVLLHCKDGSTVSPMAAVVFVVTKRFKKEESGTFAYLGRDVEARIATQNPKTAITKTFRKGFNQFEARLQGLRVKAKRKKVARFVTTFVMNADPSPPKSRKEEIERALGKTKRRAFKI